MDRMDEYRQLLARLEETPPELEHTLERAQDRLRTARRRRLWGIPIGSLAACLALVIVLVNCFPTFASACGKIPVLRQLAQAAAWSPSLSAAVENEYVQVMNQAQSQNGITARVEYLIVDRSRVDIFFSLTSQTHSCLDVGVYTITVPDEKEGYVSTLGAYGEADGALRDLSVHFTERDTPDQLTLTLPVYDSTAQWEGTAEAGSGARETLAEFTFTLHFDPAYTQKGTMLEVDRSFTLDGQQITLQSVELYPTSLRLNLACAPENTAVLTGLYFYVEDENGRRFEPAGGLSGIADPDTAAVTSLWAESPYFLNSRNLTLRITGAIWLDSDAQRVWVDLKSGRCENLPEGVRIEWIRQTADGWTLSASAPYRQGSCALGQIWRDACFDAQGQPLAMGDQRTITSAVLRPDDAEGTLTYRADPQTQTEARYSDTIVLPGYTGDGVWLCPTYSRITRLDVPLSVALPREGEN